MTSKSEDSPQTVKEAMCCNLPCVSTPVGDVKVLLDGVKDSFVSKEHNAEELAQLVAESILHKKNGLLGRDKVIKLQLDENSVANKIYDLYRSVINI
ncbi:MAG: glycosyltransferase [Bacteroides sp.]|nr:glycosyltransferase [Bacteroides sp.]